MISSRAKTQAENYASLSQEQKENKNKPRKEGLKKMHHNPKRRAIWQMNVNLGNDFLRLGDTVHPVSIPFKNKTLLQGYCRGYEDITIGLLTSIFGAPQLVEWGFRNDVFFVKEHLFVELEEQKDLEQLKTRQVKYMDEKKKYHGHQFDHSMELKDKASINTFISNLSYHFGIDKIFLEPYCGNIEGSLFVVFETKSFSGAREFCKRDGKCNWWDIIETKAVQTQSKEIKGMKVVYFLLEHNRDSTILFVASTNSLKPLGRVVYGTGKNIVRSNKYYEEFKEIDIDIVQTNTIVSSAKSPVRKSRPTFKVKFVDSPFILI